ncbi:Cyclin domain containing protein [Elaphomyces granulatus]
MGSLAISQAVSDQLYRPYPMFGGAVNQTAMSTEAAFRASHPVAAQPPLRDHVSSRPPSASTSISNPATETSAPPSASSPGASHAPPVAPYVYPPSHATDNTSPTASMASAHGHSHSHGHGHGHGQRLPTMITHPGPRPYASHDPLAYPMQQHSTELRQALPRHPPPGDQARFPLTRMPQMGANSSPSSPRLRPTHPSTRSLGGSETPSPRRIRVRDLSHIQSFANEEYLEQSQRARRPGRGRQEVGRQYEISSMPVADIIEIVAGLLTKITTTNDLQHEHVHRHIPPPDGAAALSSQASSVLAFHGKNVPSITILSYLSRIHKYCPTTYEVFLSLLVYFDRMTEMVNKRPLGRLRRRADAAAAQGIHSRSSSTTGSAVRPPGGVPSMVTPPPSTGMVAEDPRSPSAPPSLQLEEEERDEEESFSNFFVVDSFNIHRLVIAGVTCASKFFSDVFYTNSRYAKVGGLPLVELNHLELQFLLLNDFRLSVPVEELEAYGTMLVEFYAREVAQQQAAIAAATARSPVENIHMRGSSGARRDHSELGQTPTPPAP